MLRILLLLPTGLLLGACVEAPPATPQPDTDIAALSDRWEDALNSGDVETLAGLYADDARVLAPNAGIAAGPEAVRAAFGAMIDAGWVGELTTLDARSAGGLGYNVGTYTLQAKDGSTVDRGKFIEVWERSDGRWQITNDIWNSDLPVAAPASGSKTTLIAVHEVGDAATWLGAWQGENSRRNDFLDNGAIDVRVFQHPDTPKMTGLLIDVEDPDAIRAFIASDEGAAAAATDTVRMDTLIILEEIR